MKTQSVSVKNLTTQQDVEKVNEALYDVWGVRNVEIDVKSGMAVVSFDEKAASLHDFKQAIIDSGFEISTENY